jgi:hypothetical protein
MYLLIRWLLIILTSCMQALILLHDIQYTRRIFLFIVKILRFKQADKNKCSTFTIFEKHPLIQCTIGSTNGFFTYRVIKHWMVYADAYGLDE